MFFVYQWRSLKMDFNTMKWSSVSVDEYNLLCSLLVTKLTFDMYMSYRSLFH